MRHVALLAVLAGCAAVESSDVSSRKTLRIEVASWAATHEGINWAKKQQIVAQRIAAQPEAQRPLAHRLGWIPHDERNQDFVFRSDSDPAKVYVVADGVSGSFDGSRASITAVTDFVGTSSNWRPGRQSRSMEERLRDAFSSIHDALLQALTGDIKDSLEATGADPALVARLNTGRDTSLSTTFTALVLEGESAYLAHAGDSRLYRLRPKSALEKLSTDHNKLSQYTADDAASLSPSERAAADNTLTLALSSFKNRSHEAQYRRIPLYPGIQLFILCTDGLTKFLDDRKIEQVKGKVKGRQGDAPRTDAATFPPDAYVKPNHEITKDHPALYLVAKANAAAKRAKAATDNISAIVVQVVVRRSETATAPATAPDA